MGHSKISLLRRGAEGLRRGGLWAIFGLVLVIPKVNRLRSRRKLWNFVRILMALAGVMAVAFGAARPHSFMLLVPGALMLLLAILLTPERPEFSVDAKVRELGALLAVDGGYYTDGAGSRHRAKLFIGTERLWVVDASLQVLVEIPLQQVRTVSVEPAGMDWSFRVDCAQTTAEFIYHGGFAEHLARVADATVRSRLQHELPILR
jgi:hypothetical protein